MCLYGLFLLSYIMNISMEIYVSSYILGIDSVIKSMEAIGPLK